eukprot:2206748-Amphidinium_carterae.1
MLKLELRMLTLSGAAFQREARFSPISSLCAGWRSVEVCREKAFSVWSVCIGLLLKKRQTSGRPKKAEPGRLFDPRAGRRSDLGSETRIKDRRNVNQQNQLNEHLKGQT